MYRQATLSNGSANRNPNQTTLGTLLRAGEPKTTHHAGKGGSDAQGRV